MQHYDAILPLQLKTLKLSTFNAHWEEDADLAKHEGWTYDHYLSHLCEREIQKRENSRLSRRIKEAALPKDKTLSTFHFKENETINAAQIKAWFKSGLQLTVILMLSSDAHFC